jgi:hypothetical protein
MPMPAASIFGASLSKTSLIARVDDCY